MKKITEWIINPIQKWILKGVMGQFPRMMIPLDQNKSYLFILPLDTEMSVVEKLQDGLSKQHPNIIIVLADAVKLLELS